MVEATTKKSNIILVSPKIWDKWHFVSSIKCSTIVQPEMDLRQSRGSGGADMSRE